MLLECSQAAYPDPRPTGLAVEPQGAAGSCGPGVLVDAAAVATNLRRMVRLADSNGIPFDDMTSDLGRQVREDLNLTAFASAEHSLQRMTQEDQ